ncbi:MAG TPA: HNH endonuclease [Candidatus Acidoferrum sp.]
MKNKVNAELVWKQFEDLLVPRLRLSVTDRAVYSHLLRHSRLEGKAQLRFSIPWLGRGAGLSSDTVRQAVRRLVKAGALRLNERSRTGHLIHVRLPDEVRAVRTRRTAGWRTARTRGASLEKIDFLRTRSLRRAIHVREGGRCFYCLRQVPYRVRCLDHVVPQARWGQNSYRNLVSTCVECNSRKGERPAVDFLRMLYRERRLSATELTARLGALDAVAGGKVRPALVQSERRQSRLGDGLKATQGTR